MFQFAKVKSGLKKTLKSKDLMPSPRIGFNALFNAGTNGLAKIAEYMFAELNGVLFLRDFSRKLIDCL